MQNMYVSEKLINDAFNFFRDTNIVTAEYNWSFKLTWKFHEN